MLISFVLAFVYWSAWIVLARILGASELGPFLHLLRLQLPLLSNNQFALVLEIVADVPFIASLALTARYHLAEASLWTWAGLLMRATVVQMAALALLMLICGTVMGMNDSLDTFAALIFGTFQ